MILEPPPERFLPFCSNFSSELAKNRKTKINDSSITQIKPTEIVMKCIYESTVKHLAQGTLALTTVLFIVSAYADPSAQCLRILKADDFDTLTQVVSKEWEEMYEEYSWRVWIDSPADYARFINPPDLVANNGAIVHPTEIYKNGLAQFRAMKDASDYLAEIPRGHLKLSADLIRKVHQITMKDVYSFREKVAYKVGGGFFNISGPGKFKKFFNFGFSPLKNPLSDAELTQIRTDSLIDFVQFFRSGENKNYGLLVFPGSPEKRVQELLEWYATNEKVMNPIKLAAGFQRRLVAIHPFDNGNGRVSRLFMDRILAENGLPPSLLRNQELDLYSSEADWVREVAAGVAEYTSMAQQAIHDSKKLKSTNGAPFIGNHDHGTWVEKSGVADAVTYEELVPDPKKSKFTAKNQHTFILYRDGFFYSEVGIPHVYQAGVLFPIADQNYLLYGLAGPSGQKSNEAGNVYRRALSPQMESVYRGNLSALTRINDGTLNPETIQVQAYADIADANRKGQFKFQSWEKKWLKSAIDLDGKTPGAILAANRGGFTEFEKAFNANENVRISSILAQYQTVDLHYAKLELHFRKVDKDPELVQVIEANRKKLWVAVRYYIDLFETQFSNFAKSEIPELESPEAAFTLLRETPQLNLFYEYLPYTRAGYRTWDEATKAVASDTIYLLRNDFKAVRWLGFLPEQSFAKILAGIPGAEAFRNYVRKRLTSLPLKKGNTLASDKPGSLDETPKVEIQSTLFAKLFKALEQKIFVNPYSTRGVDEEFQREYVNLYLHAVDRGQKSGVSFTARSDQMVQANGNLSFQGIAGVKYQTYIVKTSVSASVNNYASGWYRQYEVIVKGYTGPLRTVKAMASEDLEPPPTTPTSEKITTYLKNKQQIRIQ